MLPLSKSRDSRYRLSTEHAALLREVASAYQPREIKSRIRLCFFLICFETDRSENNFTFKAFPCALIDQVVSSKASAPQMHEERSHRARCRATRVTPPMLSMP